ncbi:MAG: bifunctional precorrin-2 dehydrogenase/sirohydrochlorin ferrochelatase [Clostridia bacterium]|nr:bifunctional precorrin-2 dehydrogenase/sirohydrochlorin ferrochelatase [Clostridia bacterium]
MPVFPLFINLKNKKCIVIGGGNVAERKIEALLEFNADITVISPKITTKLNEMHKEQRFTLIREEYRKGMLQGAFLVIAGTSDNSLNELIYKEATDKGIFVNVVDCPGKCTFIFPSLVRREDLVVGISTSGGYPALSKRIREEIEKLLPETFGTALDILKKYRKRAIQEIPDENLRKEVLNKLLDEVFAFKQQDTVEHMETRINSVYERYRHE